MADSEQLRLDIGICVKGPEGSETIEVEPVSQPGCAVRLRAVRITASMSSSTRTGLAMSCFWLAGP